MEAGDLVTGELADRNELLFSVCRNKRCARFGESIIIASTVEVEDKPDKRCDSVSSVWDKPSKVGQPISSRARSMDGASGLSCSRIVFSRAKVASKRFTSREFVFGSLTAFVCLVGFDRLLLPGSGVGDPSTCFGSHPESTVAMPESCSASLGCRKSKG